MQGTQGDQSKQTATAVVSSTFVPGSGEKPTVNRGRVWVLENGKPHSVRVETGISDGTYVEVLSGLTPGQKIITGVSYKTAAQGVAATSSIPFGGGANNNGPRRF